MFAAISGMVTALGQMAGAVTSYLSFKQGQDMTELGTLRQQVQMLQAENAALKVRLTAVVGASATPGSSRL